MGQGVSQPPSDVRDFKDIDSPCLDPYHSLIEVKTLLNSFDRLILQKWVSIIGANSQVSG